MGETRTADKILVVYLQNNGPLEKPRYDGRILQKFMVK
jgi:hypothetical protein